MDKATCLVDDCARPKMARGLCANHYQAAKKAGTLDQYACERKGIHKVCSVDGCEKRGTSRGWCSTHYARWRTTGSVADPVRAPKKLCKLGDCDRPVAGQGYCKYHHEKLIRAGKLETLKPQKFCEAPDCDLPVMSATHCQKHWLRLKKHGSIEKPMRGRETCTHPGCDKKHFGRGYCRLHFTRSQNGYPMDAPVLTKPPGKKRLYTACAVDGCPEQPKARGWCSHHYGNWSRNGNPLTVIERPVPVRCAVEDCERLARVKGHCKMHDQRIKRWGDPHYLARKPPRPAADDLGTCSIEGCENENDSVSAQMCLKHLREWRASPDYTPKEPQSGMQCTVPSCVYIAKVKRICIGHYQRLNQYGDVMADLPLGWKISPPPPCTAPGCEMPQAGRRVCVLHYGTAAGWSIYDLEQSASTDTDDWLAIIDGDPCSYCGGPTENIDHIHPKSKGGPDHWENFAPTCRHCNQSKMVDSVLDFMMRRLQEADSDNVVVLDRSGRVQCSVDADRAG